MSITIPQYVPLAIRTEKPLPTLERLIHGCMGLITEIGEVTTELKRMAIYGKPLDAERKSNLIEESGDVMWYVAIMLDTVDADLERLPTEFCNVLSIEYNDEKFPALALMLGEHCGRVSIAVQGLCTEEGSQTQYLLKLLESLVMIITGVAFLTESCDSTLGQAMEQNIAKLTLRYPEKYSNEAAEGRADKAGADARVS